MDQVEKEVRSELADEAFELLKEIERLDQAQTFMQKQEYMDKLLEKNSELLEKYELKVRFVHIEEKRPMYKFLYRK